MLTPHLESAVEDVDWLRREGGCVGATSRIIKVRANYNYTVALCVISILRLQGPAATCGAAPI